MSSELVQLREAAEKYTSHDAGTHEVWTSLVWEQRSESPVARLEDAVEFLSNGRPSVSKLGALPSGGLTR